MAEWTGCIAGRVTQERVPGAHLEDAGFENIEDYREIHRVHDQAGSAIIRATVPG